MVAPKKVLFSLYQCYHLNSNAQVFLQACCELDQGIKLSHYELLVLLDQFQTWDEFLSLSHLVIIHILSLTHQDVFFGTHL